MTPDANQRVTKGLSFLFILILHLIIFWLLGRVVLFQEPAQKSDFRPSFQLVNIAVPQVPVSPPPSSLPTHSIPTMSASLETSLPAMIVTAPSRMIFNLPRIPSPQEMLAHLPQPGFGHGVGNGEDNSSGNSHGGGNGDEGHQDNEDASQERTSSLAHHRKVDPMHIFDFIMADDVESVRAWLDDGNDPNVSKPMQEHSAEAHLTWPLSLAVRNHQRKIVKMLLEHGASPDPAEPLDKKWPGMVYFAVEYHCKPELLKLLLDHGARPGLRMPSDPADRATPEWSGPLGRNALMEAVKPTIVGDSVEVLTPDEQVAILQILLKHGDDPLRKDEYGETALSMARELHRQDMVSAIEDFLSQPR